MVIRSTRIFFFLIRTLIGHNVMLQVQGIEKRRKIGPLFTSTMEIGELLGISSDKVLGNLAALKKALYINAENQLCVDKEALLQPGPPVYINISTSCT